MQKDNNKGTEFLEFFDIENKKSFLITSIIIGGLIFSIFINILNIEFTLTVFSGLGKALFIIFGLITFLFFLIKIFKNFLNIVLKKISITKKPNHQFNKSGTTNNNSILLEEEEENE